MRTFLLGGHSHQRGISRISYLTDLFAHFLSKIKTLHLYIYIHSEAWFARDAKIHTLAMIHTLVMGNINCHTCVLKCQK